MLESVTVLGLDDIMYACTALMHETVHRIVAVPAPGTLFIGSLAKIDISTRLKILCYLRTRLKSATQSP